MTLWFIANNQNPYCSPRDFKAHQGYGLGSAKWDSQVHDGTWLLGYIPKNQGCIKLMQVSKEKHKVPGI
jgi:hypothetical protein